jgi:hypothetical protein
MSDTSLSLSSDDLSLSSSVSFFSFNFARFAARSLISTCLVRPMLGLENKERGLVHFTLHKQ